MNLIIEMDELGLELEAFAAVDKDAFGYGIEGLTIVLNHPTKVIKHSNGTESPLCIDVTAFLNKRQIALIKEQFMNEFDSKLEELEERSKGIEK